MTYDASETSVASGAPYFLYLFDNGVTQVRLTSDAADLTKMTQTWVASPVSHGDVEQGGNIERQVLNLNFPISDSFARSVIIPSGETWIVTVWRGHHTDLTEEHVVIWKGRIVGGHSTRGRIDVDIESVFTSLRRTGCGARYSRTCRHAHYHLGCGLDITDFQSAGTVSVVTGNVLTVAEAAAAPAGDFKAGIIEWNGRLGFITAHSGNQLTLMMPVSGLEAAVALAPQAVLLAPGCNLSRDRCETRFANHLNFGGFPYPPGLNPFQVSLI